MLDSEANAFAPDPWTELLRQARSALSSLRAEDLEDLAARAECMLSATVGRDPVRQRMPGPRRQVMLAVTEEQRGLRELLIETDQNLKVLRAARGVSYMDRHGSEVNSRWVR